MSMASLIHPLPNVSWLHPLIERLKTHIAQEVQPRDAAHDLAHILRVARLAAEIAEQEHADVDVCVAGALLHDLVYVPKNHPDSSRSADLAATLVLQWCQEMPELQAKAKAIAETVASHSWSGGKAPASLEAEVVQDADRLEAIGAIGIARVFATGASFGSALWHSEDPWGERRELDDKRYTLDHFFRKLLKLAEGMKTQTGKDLAKSRQRVLENYLLDLRRELGF
jgi:uncharacterized protein